jgi:hypothetical protein
MGNTIPVRSILEIPATRREEALVATVSDFLTVGFSLRRDSITPHGKQRGCGAPSDYTAALNKL